MPGFDDGWGGDGVGRRNSKLDTLWSAGWGKKVKVGTREGKTMLDRDWEPGRHQRKGNSWTKGKCG